MSGPGEPSATLRIGEALKRARTGRGMDVRTAEELTKIRIKYLRALEGEDWDVLPSPAYAKGFLRTYASMLGLDAEAFVDEYRRQVERHEPDADINPLGEPMLEHRVRVGQRDSRRLRGPALLAIAAVAVAVAAVAIATSGGEDGGRTRQSSAHGKRHDGRVASRKHRAEHAAAGKPVALELLARQAIEVCLVRGEGEAVIDSQALDAGAASTFQAADRYRLDLDSGGTVELTLNGKRRVVRSRRPATFLITSAGVDEVGFRGPGCP